MATKTLFSLAVAALCCTASQVSTPTRHGEQLDADELQLIGFAGHVPDSKKPKVTAYFEHESYAPGASATLVVEDTAAAVSVQIMRAGGETEPTIPNDVMLGVAVTQPAPAGAVRGRRTLVIHVGNWPSGVYFARLTAPGHRVGYAPFVLRPRRLGEHPIAVVLPTETWQAYNFRDDDGDGTPDTWYAGWHTNHARLVRPFLDRGVPPHWKQYDAPFIRWLSATGRAVDYLSDEDLRTVPSGAALAKAYTLMVFEGHHEYVTRHEYDAVTRFRDLGGNLAFLAANNFFWKITIANHVMTRVAQWRDLGRPEAALIGVEYRANDRGGHRGPWIVRDGTSPLVVGAGEEIGSGGIEIDATAKASPRSTRVLAEIPNLYGPGFTAQMTYYDTPAGAKVFAAGAFSLAGSVWEPGVEQLVANVWNLLGKP